MSYGVIKQQQLFRNMYEAGFGGVTTITLDTVLLICNVTAEDIWQDLDSSNLNIMQRFGIYCFTVIDITFDFVQALIIQKYVRGWLARRRYQKQKRQIILCQAAVRRYFARKQYKKLKIEARSIEHVKKLNKGLENKIISLQQKIEGLNKVQNDYRNAQNEINELR